MAIDLYSMPVRRNDVSKLDAIIVPRLPVCVAGLTDAEGTLRPLPGAATTARGAAKVARAAGLKTGTGDFDRVETVILTDDGPQSRMVFLMDREP